VVHDAVEPPTAAGPRSWLRPSRGINQLGTAQMRR